MIRNALTIDVEDYYHVSAFESVIRVEDWEHYESRVEKNTHRYFRPSGSLWNKSNLFCARLGCRTACRS